jgi:hypothetical protein
MYGCSPEATPGYISEEMAERLCKALRRLGQPSLHIGGGEPFLDADGLAMLVKVMKNNGFQLDYIETNAAWITNSKEQNQRVLEKVMRAGRNICVMVSADPFHIAYIPFWKTETLIRLLDETGTSSFIWQERYLSLLAKLDARRTYSGDELRQELGYDAYLQCAKEYGMGFNGRALNLLREYGKKQPAESFLEERPCSSLLNTGHFHVDFLGRYVPSGCTGMGILVEDLERELDPGLYPTLSRLFSKGLRSLWQYASLKGFMPDPCGYASKCDLCYSIRKHLAMTYGNDHPDLSPVEFYLQDF